MEQTNNNMVAETKVQQPQPEQQAWKPAVSLNDIFNAFSLGIGGQKSW